MVKKQKTRCFWYVKHRVFALCLTGSAWQNSVCGVSGRLGAESWDGVPWNSGILVAVRYQLST
ncbi:MAG: hypothetical protein IIT76_12765 [Prevotella sp.]|nr:hypothetical protein [Prevotella sp.]